MRKLLILIIFISFSSSAKSDNYHATYQNYLDKCAANVTSSSHYPHSSEHPTLIFEGENLSTDCLVEQFANHHKNSKITQLNDPDKFLEVDKTEFVERDNYSTITSLYDFTCGETCRIGKNILIENENKFYLIVSFNSDAGYEANLVNKNIIHIKENMHTRTNNTLFNIESKTFNNIGSGNVEFSKNGYLKKGIKSYAFQDGEPQGAFWFDAKYSFNNDLIELLDFDGKDKQCLPKAFFESNEIILKNLEKLKKESLCVMKF